MSTTAGNATRTEASRRDPLVDEIRAIKQRVSAAAGHDVRVLCIQLEQEQTAQQGRLVDRRAARKSATSTGTP